MIDMDIFKKQWSN